MRRLRTTQVLAVLSFLLLAAGAAVVLVLALMAWYMHGEDR